MFSAVFSAQYSSLSPISVLVRDLAERLGFNDKQVFDIELAVDEAVSNIIDHAYGGEGNGEFVLNMDSDDRGLTIILQDRGKAFSPADVPHPDLISDVRVRRERGLGVFLIHQLMDFVHYEVTADGSNQLTIKKFLQACPDHQSSPDTRCPEDLLPAEALQLVSEINRSISSIVDLEELLSKVTDLIQKTLNYPFVHLYIYDYVPQKLVFVSGSGSRAAFYRENHVTYDINAYKGLIPLAAKSGRYYLANDLGNNPWHQPDPLAQSSEGSELSLPLQFRGELLGVLDVQSDQTNAFDEQEVNLLESLAITISVAIRNAQLFKAQDWRRKLAESYRETAEMLTREFSLEEVLHSIMLQIPPILPVEFIGIWLTEPVTNHLKLYKSLNISKEGVFGDEIDLPPGDTSDWFHPSSLRSEAISHPENAGPDQIALALKMSESYSAIASPIISEGRSYGVLTLHTDSAGRYGVDSRNICSTFADYIAYALDKERLRAAEAIRQQTEQELNLARRIQKTFLPEKLPQIPGYELAVEWETARQVGGDFYDVIGFEDGRFGVLIADVSDKGLPASLYMTVARTLIRAVARDYTSPAEALRRVNQLLQLDSTQSFFVTVLYLILNTYSGEVTFTIAGHTPPIVLQPELNQATSLSRGGIALGILDPILIKDERIQLLPGESIFLYTDGVSETRDIHDEEYGEKQLQQVLRNAASLPARKIIDQVLQDLAQFRATETFEDDCTILVLKRD